ncbi:MAG: NapC/NirT family cytochrome c [Spirochaetia bacterium]|nr:NapC/NirT family cytochrome c [Spirochaetia bacterium]
MEKLRKALQHFLEPITRNMIGLIGVIVTTVMGVVTLFLSLLQFAGVFENPYAGVIIFAALPPVFIGGLLLIALGYYIDHREKVKGGQLPHKWPVFDFNKPENRIRTIFIVTLTVVNALIVGLGASGGMNYMNSPKFCGQVCHTVMSPEYTAFQNSPHSKVRCVDCHVGGGLEWWVKSKISGLRQVIGVMTGSYAKPVPSPVHNLRPAQGTCEECHWPDKFIGDRRRIFTKHNNDEESTPNYSVLYLKVGGQKGGPDGKYEGIHWHVNKNAKVEFKALDDRRAKIGWVKVTKKDGKVVEYFTEEYTKTANKETLEAKEMDCLDCHNRPTHEFYLPEKALNLALSDGRLDRKLPFLYRESLRVLKKEYAEEQIDVEIPKQIKAYYSKEHPEIAKQEVELINKTADQLVKIYRRNNWPKMELRWGFHKSHIGHNDVPGCGRCHNADMLTKDGKGLSDVEGDCENCHDVLVEEEEDLCAVKKVLHPGSEPEECEE